MSGHTAPHAANVLKYFEHEYKNGLEDIDKAIWYLNRLKKRYKEIHNVITLDDIDAWNGIKEMNFEEYQIEAEKTAIYPDEHKIDYQSLGLAGEAGEVVQQSKENVKQDGKFDREDVAAEVGDCLWYIAALCRDLNFDMGYIARCNLDKLHSRMERGTIQGSGDKR